MRTAATSCRIVPVMAALALAGCSGARALRVEPAPGPEETTLLAHLQRDPFADADHAARDADGRLLVTMQQGIEQRRYLLAPDSPSEPALRLRPVDDRCLLPGPASEQPGTGPEPRGLAPRR